MKGHGFRMIHGFKRLIPALAAAAALATVAAIVRRKSRESEADGIVVRAPLAAPAIELASEPDVPGDEPQRISEPASEPLAIVSASEDERRLRMAYIFAATAVVVIAVVFGLVWLLSRPSPAKPIAGPSGAAMARPSEDSSNLPPLVPDTSGAACQSADPCHIAIGAINVNTSVMAKPTEMSWDPFLKKTVSSFGVPSDFTTTAWWSDGPLPGAAGMAVILGHHYSAGYGVFNDLGNLKGGDVIEIRVGHQVLDYRVDVIDSYLPKTDANALSDALSNRASHEDLALISCTGAGDPASHQIVANVVVFAKLVAEGNIA